MGSELRSRGSLEGSSEGAVQGRGQWQWQWRRGAAVAPPWTAGEGEGDGEGEGEGLLSAGLWRLGHSRACAPPPPPSRRRRRPLLHPLLLLLVLLLRMQETAAASSFAAAMEIIQSRLFRTIQAAVQHGPVGPSPSPTQSHPKNTAQGAAALPAQVEPSPGKALPGKVVPEKGLLLGKKLPVKGFPVKKFPGKVSGPGVQPLNVFNVQAFGAKGNGVTDDSRAIMAAFSASCGRALAQAPGASSATPAPISVLVFPRPAAAYVARQPLTLQGPCAVGQLYILLSGRLIFDAKDAATEDTEALLDIRDISGVVVSGRPSAALLGGGTDWWKQKSRPHLLQFHNCTNARLHNVMFVDPPRCHVNIVYSAHVWASKLATWAPDGSPNTDSIHIGHSQDVLVERSRLHSGDDCVSIVGNTRDVIVRNMLCTAGHGYSIGSLGYGGKTVCMRNITVRDSELRGTTNGVRIKTYQGGKGFVRDVLFLNINMVRVTNPIVINQYYCDIKPCHVQPDAVALYGIAFKRIMATTDIPMHAVAVNCSDTVPCSRLTFRGIQVLATDSSQGISPLIRNSFGISANTRGPSFSSLAQGPPPRELRAAVRKEALLCGVKNVPF